MSRPPGPVAERDPSERTPFTSQRNQWEPRFPFGTYLFKASNAATFVLFVMFSWVNDNTLFLSNLVCFIIIKRN